jgi:hypothetical protein
MVIQHPGAFRLDHMLGVSRLSPNAKRDDPMTVSDAISLFLTDARARKLSPNTIVYQNLWASSPAQAQ